MSIALGISDIGEHSQRIDEFLNSLDCRQARKLALSGGARPSGIDFETALPLGGRAGTDIEFHCIPELGRRKGH
nr:hypothetical protein KitaXyl93_22890 [Kitasatospora sp. Xyl93]